MMKKNLGKFLMKIKGSKNSYSTSILPLKSAWAWKKKAQI